VSTLGRRGFSAALAAALARLMSVSINASDLASCSALGYLRDVRILQTAMLAAAAGTRSTYDAVSDERFAFDEIAGGTQRLPEAMARALKGGERLNRVAASIEMSAANVEVKTLDGERFIGRYAISSLPFSALRNIDVRPDFVGAQLDAVRQSAHDNTIRVFMEHSSPLRESDIGESRLFTDTALEIL
jgi:monoamine oxidase